MARTSKKTKTARAIVNRRASFDYTLGDELWLNNASFSLVLNEKDNSARTVDTSPRKLLASRRQIAELAARKQAGMTIVPLRLLTQGRFIKLVIALGKGKKNYDKRQAIKQRDQERESRRGNAS